MAQYSTHPGAADALAAALAELGPMTQTIKPPDTAVSRYVGRVPDILLDLWTGTGVGDLRDGTLRLCLPLELAPQIADLFRGDPDFGFPRDVEDHRPVIAADGTPTRRDTDVHAVAHTVFGDLFLWSERHGLMHVNIVQGLIEAPFLFAPDAAPHPDDATINLILRTDPFLLDMDDRDMQPMHGRALEKFGPLRRMFIYAPGPAATHDPIPTVDALFPHTFPEWLEERIRSKRWFLSDMSTQRFDVRPIGLRPEATR
ncbi:GAD-like domain-containing protein [uncultured Tateyamaria sp.]|uniref:GAD-like domain-containing protein n=1 Tax=Tateyamaria sp. 1078 TaxID=3417464 RepID=UPI002604A61A|nr:GAD-like domain-containing protein [uncultured Tateyamaria sp.]